MSWMLATAQQPEMPVTPCLIRPDCDSVQINNPIRPYLFAPGDCNYGSININRYLSRSADVGGLTDLINNTDFSNTECDPPYISLPYSDYCPDNYCRTIQALVNMDIQFIQRAYSAAAYHEHQFFPGDHYFDLGRQIVRDIQYAYDCAGKMRPVIQATVFEVVDHRNFLNAVKYNDAEGVDRHIPAAIIEKYFEAFPQDRLKTDPMTRKSYGEYYSTPRFFTRNRICLPAVDDQQQATWRFDINKVEMRMWFLYQAYSLIDMGYTAIHMGIYESYGCSLDGSYADLYTLTQAIRNYARNSPNTGFILLSGEPLMEGKDHGLSAKFGDHFIFDFDSRAMRPREIKGGISGDGNWPDGCQSPVANEIIQALNDSPCSGWLLPAVVDPCTVNSFGRTIAGITPLGCPISQLPYTVHFDGFHPPQNPGVASNGPNSLTWGYHDHQWFSSLAPECRRWWFDYFFGDRKNYHNRNGAIVIPGIIFYDADFAIPDNESAMQLIADDPVFVEMLANETLLPKMPALRIKEQCYQEVGCVDNCNGDPAPDGKKWKVGAKSYTISVDNKDYTSTYSIHVKDPQGNWLPVVVGDQYRVFPEMDGYYEIWLRQDNLGLPAKFYGTREWATQQWLTNYCCDHLVDDVICEKLPLQIFPNPTTGLFYLEYFPRPMEKVTVTVFNLVGQVEYSTSFTGQQGVNVWEIDLSPLKSGCYVVSVVSGAEKRVTRIIKHP